MKRFSAFLLPLAALLSSPLLAAADSTAPPPCANACYNYLTQLASQAASSGNAAIQTLQGGVTAAQIVSMCDAAKPLDCCACGAPATPGVDVLDRWTLACATLAANPQDGGAAAAACFNSGGKSTCTDYGGLLEGANCTMPGGRDYGGGEFDGAVGDECCRESVGDGGHGRGDTYAELGDGGDGCGVPGLVMVGNSSVAGGRCLDGPDWSNGGGLLVLSAIAEWGNGCLNDMILVMHVMQ